MATRTAGLNPPRLSAATAARLAPDVLRPGYGRSSVQQGILHLGVGAFMRAHIALYCDDALGAGDSDWGIAGVSLRKPDVFEQLAPQDCLYTVGIHDGQESRFRLVGSLLSIAVAPREPGRVLDRIAAQQTRIVTITVTEKGYCLASTDGALDVEHEDIAHDLAKPAEPRSLVGYLVEGLRRRHAGDGGPLTILSCDNLPANGTVLRRAVMDFCNLAQPGLTSWVEQNVSFPASMVDRIVPATTGDDIDRATSRIGLLDAAHVRTEAFSQWVIEDDFRSGRPAWDAAGALFVQDVTPYEKAKLRLLNGAHSSIAYLGYLAGYEFVHEVMADPDLAAFIEQLMRGSISPVTPQPGGMAHGPYIDRLLARFSNPALQHRTWQIAMDGSQKLPQRLLGTIRDRLAAGAPVDALCLPLAAWMRYVAGKDERGARIDVSDPLAGRFAAIAADCGGESARYVRQILAVESVFGADLPANAAFVEILTRQLQALVECGTLAAVRRCLHAEEAPAQREDGQ